MYSAAALVHNGVPLGGRIDRHVEIDRRQYLALAANRFLPDIVYAQISRRCNLKCAMCGWQVWKRNSGTMSEEIFDRIIDEIQINHIRHLAFTGAQGEPLLNPHAGEFIFKALESGLSVEINTNCTTLGDANIEMLAEASRFDHRFRIQASFSGYDKQSHETVYVGSNFETTSRKLKKLFDALDEEHQLRCLQINGIILDGSSPAKHRAYLSSIGIEPDKVRIRFHGPDNFAGLVPVAEGRSIEGSRLRLCPVLAYNLIVYDDGNVSACACRDSEGVMAIGNIMTDSLISMRNSEPFHKMLDAFMARDISSLPLCRNCDIPYLGHV